ncbi:hypothetical protein BOV88_13285 [Solemya velum gill symbiont]|uniref:Uncharacterized protein n=1 Tax=Solemya velum gill symbiont TaxID=2340 RepID=A0A1T2DEB1_SOVGS|nr:hypothetical protein [Solemya velum gill symbiont]OOY33818.1 hypothetical protein BOV88_13285 [Solemya velum gill symbiont]OOY45420.1 hypothetical protein BOV93_13215 [Solemya velum gill symbiont]OOY49131.1 hypothetical protein BOV94_12265 [Solemya velum gill symbiont]
MAHKRIANIDPWIPMDKRIDFPPRKPELRKPLYWLMPDGDDLFFVNATNLVLDEVSATTGGYSTDYDPPEPFTTGEGYKYIEVMPNEAVKIDHINLALESDAVIQDEIIVKTHNQETLVFRVYIDKKGSREIVLLWDNLDVGKDVRLIDND